MVYSNFGRHLRRIRFRSGSNFDQSPDKRRHGTKPKNIAENVYAISNMMKGKVSFLTLDYQENGKELPIVLNCITSHPVSLPIVSI